MVYSFDFTMVINGEYTLSIINGLPPSVSHAQGTSYTVTSYAINICTVSNCMPLWKTLRSC